MCVLPIAQPADFPLMFSAWKIMGWVIVQALFVEIVHANLSKFILSSNHESEDFKFALTEQDTYKF